MPTPGDHARSRRFAFATLEPPSACPGFTLRRALEEHGGNPKFGLAASDYGVMHVIFPSQAIHDGTLLLFPTSVDGHLISLERPEERDNSVCCIDPLCLNEPDFSTVRLNILIESADGVPPVLIMRDSEGEMATAVDLRVVRVRRAEDDGARRLSCHFGDTGGFTPRRGLSDIDDASLRGSGALSPVSPPTGYAPALTRPTCHGPPASDGPGLFRRILARCPVMDDAAANGLSGGLEAFHSILASRLAAQFPEAPAHQASMSTTGSPLVPSTPAPRSSPVVVDLTESPQPEPTEVVDLTGCVDDLAHTDLVEVVDLTVSPPMLFLTSAEDHEIALCRRQAQNKQACDSAFKARRSSRLAAKEPVQFRDMLDKDKAAKASRFDSSKGSPRLRKAIADAGLADGFLDFIPLPRLQDLAVACRVDPSALVDADGA
ncbi:unnamed protein product [Alopecurus aequalis]